jgi:hypothetical protein
MNQRDLKQHFEAILGEGIEGAGDDVTVRSQVATYTAKEKGFVTSRDIGTTGDETKHCGEAILLDVGGIARTGADGTAEFMLSQFYCDRDVHLIRFEYPTNIVATSLSQAPAFVTAEANLAGDRHNDVRVRVATWDARGRPAPNTTVHWRCRVPYEPTSLGE